jgi:outer membrane protein assembly factor BamB
MVLVESARRQQCRARLRWLGAVPACVLLALLTIAADWPTYLHDPQRGAANPTETILSPSNAAQLVKLWSFPTGGPVAASPTIAAGAVYVGSWDGYEYALDATTGALKWKTFLGTTTTSNCGTMGVTSTATVRNGVVYVGGGDAYWYALDATSGAILWKVFTGDNSATGGHYNWSSPLVYHGDAYIGVASDCDAPLVQGQVLQVDLSSHQIVHTFDVVPSGQVGGGIWTSPSVDPATNAVYVTTGNQGQNPPTTQPQTVALLDLDASTLGLRDSWQVPASQMVSDSDWGTTPTLITDTVGDPLVAAVNKNGYLYTFDRTHLAAGPVWQRRIGAGGSSPRIGEGSVSSGAFGAGRLYMAGGETTINTTPYSGSVGAYDPATGHVLWRQGTSKPVLPALAYANGLVIDGAGPTLEVRDAATGRLLYHYTTGKTIYSAPSIANGQLFVGSTNGNVYAFGLSSVASTGSTVPPEAMPLRTPRSTLVTERLAPTRTPRSRMRPRGRL